MVLRSWIRGHRGSATVAALVVVALAGFAVYWFAPQRLLLNERVDEALPAATGAPTPTSTGPVGEQPAPERLVLASGGFQSLEHGTSGRAIVLELADGRRFLRLENLDTSNGPDLRVYLTDQPLSDDWHVWDDGVIVDLGALKGNVGSSNYEISAGMDLSRFRTAVVWCRRFEVGFGVAPLDLAS
jgi:hypothetical protein